jgi:hypothetical protein
MRNVWIVAASLHSAALTTGAGHPGAGAGPEHLGVAIILKDYTALLRKMNRDDDAEKMEVRAKAIGGKHEKPIDFKVPFSPVL